MAWRTVTGYGERLEAQTVAYLPPYEGMAPVGDPDSGPGPAVVALSAEIDMANADDVGEQLRSAFTPGVTIVVADMTLTMFAAPMACAPWCWLIAAQPPTMPSCA